MSSSSTAAPRRRSWSSNDAIKTVMDLRQQGKVRFIGMSSTLPNITDHVKMGVFDVFQIPYSALQRDHEQVIAEAARPAPAS